MIQKLVRQKIKKTRTTSEKKSTDICETCGHARAFHQEKGIGCLAKDPVVSPCQCSEFFALY